MTITVNIADADLNELLARVEAGEEVILVRDGMPIAQFKSLAEPKFDAEKHLQAIEAIRAFRATMPSATQEEIAEWKAYGRK